MPTSVLACGGGGVWQRSIRSDAFHLLCATASDPTSVRAIGDGLPRGPAGAEQLTVIDDREAPQLQITVVISMLSMTPGPSRPIEQIEQICIPFLAPTPGPGHGARGKVPCILPFRWTFAGLKI
ncbi:hypothetical protein FA95DRAFT_593835 [Auriscalpium vulgare]|uniref:Uncharacterized protein n=1 Tax=Auriscalpium vulgare TaxID=40419 RepID=A0ACB8S365_9AGAM|nr:hypothetical protein FA95DRAFT_593835 [Auriscalpium vulgare]